MTRGRIALVSLALGCSDPPAMTPIDALVVDDLPDTAVDIDAAPPRTEVTLFVADYGRGVIDRFQITAATSAPVPDLTFPVTRALSPVIMPVSGELLVSDLSAASIARVRNPLAIPSEIGAVSGFGIASQAAKMAVLGDEVWVVNPVASNVIRLTFDASGSATAGGPGIAATTGRGIVHDLVHRQFFVSQCCGTNAILRFALAPNGVPSQLPTITGGGLDNPHGMAITPWNELYVANANTSSLLRYSLDAAGAPTVLAAVTGNGLSVPVDLALTPWNELYVVNQGTSVISRYTFDPTTHEPVFRDTFPVPLAQSLAYFAMY